jgi:CheY-like chemotaxis protein
MIREKLNLSPEKIPIILLHSSSDDHGLRVECKKLGVRFNLVKPVKADELFHFIRNINEEEVGEVILPAPEEVNPGGDSLVILVAEDVAINMKLIKAILEELLPQAVIFEALNGQAAVEIVTSRKVDLVLMDVQMPVLDGMEATRRIREWEVRNGKEPIPIIALTAGALKEEQKRALDSGMDEFLTKPLEPVKLEAVFRKYLFQVPLSAHDSGEKRNSEDEHFGYERLLELFSGDRRPIQELMKEGTKYMIEKMEVLAGAISNGDAHLIQTTAHAIKGSALSMRYDTLGSIAGQIEQSSREGDTEAMIQLLVKLKDEWVLISEIAKKYR